MEFLLDSENIHIKITPPEQETISTNSQTHNISTQQFKDSEYTNIEILLRLDDFYLINNLKLLLPKEKDEELSLTSIKFQNSTMNTMQEAFYFNPDNKEVIARTGEVISIFCVGLTNYIHFTFRVAKDEDSDDEYLIAKTKQTISKIIIYSQYIYSIPNATFLLALLNIKNFFQNISVPSPLEQTKIDNYHCALYLTATSMIQARLFIQAWELLTSLQKIIVGHIENASEESINFFYILFEMNKPRKEIEVKDEIVKVDSIVLEEKSIEDEISVFITKIELIKAICMYEHGHFYVFLKCLKNCIVFKQKHDYSILNEKVSLAKVNDIYNDKFYIQNFLREHGEQLSDIFITFLKNKSEILKYCVLKVFEFMIDYHPSVLFKYISKVVKFLFSMNCFSINLIKQNEKEISKIEQRSIIHQLFSKKNQFFPNDLSLTDEKTQSKSTSESEEEKHCISQILQKQINYTLDTIINNLDSFSNDTLSLILSKNSKLLFEIIVQNDTENLMHIIAIKLVKKCFENISDSFFTFQTSEMLFRMFILGVKKSVKEVFKEYLSIQKKITNISQYPNKNSKEIKEIIHNTNNITNLTTTLENCDDIIELTSDIGALLSGIFEKISDEMLNIKNNIELLRFINTKIEILMKFLEENDNEEDIDLCIYYLYLLLEFLITVLLSRKKSEFKKGIYEMIFTQKAKNDSIFSSQIKQLIDNLFKVEQFTLINRKSYVLFEISIDVLLSLKKIYSPLFDSTDILSYNDYFIEQYVSLNNYIHSNGIFSDNIKFILKTLKLCEMNDKKFISTIKEIFTLFLSNFSNYYTEETFCLFTLVVGRLAEKELIDEGLFDVITRAIVLKSNYKGNSFKQCYQKYFEIIYANSTYYKHFLSDMTKYAKEFLQTSKEYRGYSAECKEKYLEFIDRIDLYKKFFDFLSQQPFSEKNLSFLITMNNAELFSLLMVIAAYTDDTIRNKLNFLFEAVFNLLENNYDIELFIAHCGVMTDYFSVVNRADNAYLINENIKLMNKIVAALNKLNVFDIDTIVKLYATVDVNKMSEISNKKIIENIMLLYDKLFIDINLMNNIPKEYTAIIIQVLSVFLQSRDRNFVIFAFEMLFKLFGLSIDSVVENEIEDIKNRILSMKSSAVYIEVMLSLLPIWKQIISLSKESDDYKVNLLSLFVINVLINSTIVNEVNELNLFEIDQLRGLHIAVREVVILPYRCTKFSSKENEDNEEEEKTDEDIEANRMNVNDGEDMYDDEHYNEGPSPIEEMKSKVSKVVDEEKGKDNVSNIHVIQTKEEMKRDLSKEEDDNLSLEDLGVVEVEDEIFDNLDEKNIPILKKNCDRAKGISAKLKTNQNSKSLLMSEHVCQP